MKMFDDYSNSSLQSKKLRRAKQNKELVLELRAPYPLVTLGLLKITSGGAPLIQPLTTRKELTCSKLVINVSSPLGGGRVLSGAWNKWDELPSRGAFFHQLHKLNS